MTEHPQNIYRVNELPNFAVTSRLIEDLNDHTLGGVVFARVVMKSPLRDTDHEGRHFSFVLEDGSGQINVICPDRLRNKAEIIQEGKFIKLTAFETREAQNRITSHKYELRLITISRIEEVDPFEYRVPTVTQN